MEGILDLLNSPMGKTIINGVATSTGNDTSKTSSVLEMGLPVLMKAMQRNATTPQGAEGLMGALGKHDGGILDNLDDLFRGGINDEVKQDGSKILNHVLGTKTGNVERAIGEKAGLNAGSVANILKVAAPILMGVLGRQKKQNNVDNSGGLGGLIGGLLGGNSNQQEQSFLEKILDADGDGSIVDDVADMVLNQGGKKSGGLLGGLLGGLFGKK